MRALLPIAAMALLGGCATNSLVLLPSEDGGHGAVAVLDGKGGETVVSQPNSRTRLAGRPTTAAYQVKPAEQALLDGLPPKPAQFILYFKEGTTDLTPESQPRLEELLAEVRRRPGVEAQVTGYTDTLGSDDDNDRLSQRRAEEVLEVLAAQGIDTGLLTAVGRGERSLLVKTGDGVREPANRRVEVIVR
ncbi:OmpA family protein [Sphingomonas montanisoli]|uniref:OmpA family protein n=1 Tax=Sphingomonas montanisoli TaxID=2606412 RepID=A0A5D9C679_9SPHN|nr:OmpA family protein [Sphingomonas montanisoli]TZG26550.1 OmpA family protein [Sphingomonas montanisoli]